MSIINLECVQLAASILRSRDKATFSSPFQVETSIGVLTQAWLLLLPCFGSLNGGLRRVDLLLLSRIEASFDYVGNPPFEAIVLDASLEL